MARVGHYIVKSSHRKTLNSKQANKIRGQMAMRYSQWCSCMIMFTEIYLPIGSCLI